MLKKLLFAGTMVLMGSASGMAVAAETSVPEPAAADLTAIRQCMSSATQGGGAVETCIGVVADKCAEASGASAKLGTVECSRRERAVWDKILGDDYENLRKTLSDATSTELRDAQRIWIDWRAAKCKFEDTIRTGPSGKPATGRCLLEETARRAAEVRSDLKLVKAG